MNHLDKILSDKHMHPDLYDLSEFIQSQMESICSSALPNADLKALYLITSGTKQWLA